MTLRQRNRRTDWYSECVKPHFSELLQRKSAHFKNVPSMSQMSMHPEYPLWIFSNIYFCNCSHMINKITHNIIYGQLYPLHTCAVIIVSEWLTLLPIKASRSKGKRKGSPYNLSEYVKCLQRALCMGCSWKLRKGLPLFICWNSLETRMNTTKKNYTALVNTAKRY